MSTAKPTPGPWRADVGGVVFDSHGHVIADVNIHDPAVVGQHEANTALIAAAPDLLAVVEKLAEWNRKYPSSRIYGESQIREIAAENDAINAEGLAAIAKVRGEGR